MASTGLIASSPKSSYRDRPRLLDDSHGEKVFFGGSASLAFLQMIRDTVSDSLDKSDFSHPAGKDRMLEVAQPQAIPIKDLPVNSEQGQAFLDAYFIATQGLLEVCTKDYILGILDDRRAPASPKSFRVAISQTVLAIGAQCLQRDEANILISQAYFAEVQGIAFAGMVEDPSLEMVQLFLLVAFYMLGACHRNAAFMYVGVAARAACVLGLHSFNSSSEENIRNRVTWQCLVNLDTMVSSILGRPSATSTQTTIFSEDVGSGIEATSYTSAAMQANYQLSSLLEQRVTELCNADKVTVDGTRLCLDQLSAWSSRLPSELRLASDTIQNVNAREKIIGGLHVSCFYYFSVMLVSRPFLVVHLTNRLARSRNGSEVMSTDLPEELAGAEIHEIASACVNAATSLVQTCLEAQAHGFLPDNMRILKAWVFAASLIHGFETFAANQSDLEIEEAFRGGCSILKVFSAHSAQAAHYFDILMSLSDAIAARSRQAMTDRKRTGRPIVEKIMAFQPPTDSEKNNESLAGDDSPTLIPAVPPDDDNSAHGTWVPSFAADLDFQDLLNDPFCNADFLSWNLFSRNLSSQ